MKKLLIFCLIAMMILATGCPGPESEPKSSDPNKTQVMDNIDMKASREFMDNYMRYVIKRDNGAMKSFYSTEIKSQMKNIPTNPNPHPVGYKIEEGENKEKNAEFRAHIYNANSGEPYYSDDVFKYTITMESGKMVINKIEKENTTEIFEKGKALYKREGDKAKGELAVALQDLPYYVVPKGAQTPEQKFPVPRKAFGPCAISPDGKSMAITSVGEQTLLAIVKQEQGGEEDKSAMSMQGDEKKAGGGGEGGEGGAEGGEGKEAGGEQEGKEGQNATIKPVDFYFEGKVILLNYSPDGKSFIVEKAMPNGLSQILLYEGESGEDMPLDTLYRQFRKDTFSIVSPYFISEEKLAFSVVPIKTATREEQKLKGDYVLDLKTQKLNQIQ
jgi:hypothetical protein